MATATRNRKSPPLALASDFPSPFPIGTKVHAHHRAGVARYGKLWKDEPATGGTGLFEAEVIKAPIGWRIVDGVYKGELIPPHRRFDLSDRDWLRYKFKDYPQARFSYGKYNKSVMIWPDNIYGWIIGMIRKGIGESHKGSYYGGGYYDPPDYDPGYFALDIYVDLYVIKQSYAGTHFVYAPLWAVSEIKDENDRASHAGGSHDDGALQSSL